MSETKRLIAALLGVVVGALLGAGAIYLVYQYVDLAARNPSVALLVWLGLGGGFVLLGGWAALTISTKIQKARRTRARASAKRGKYARRKRK